MADCEMLPTCIFFNDKMENMPQMAETYKTRYCKGAFNDCARYIVCKSKGREAVPKDLFPNQKDKAMRLI
jgi:hypothetical protein